jgi:acyl dehydratase
VSSVAIRELNDCSDLHQWVGKEFAVTDWLEVTQQRIDQFAQASGDHQWIHVDPERAKKESPFGKTIAHGFLTLSLLSHFIYEAMHIKNAKMGINYGLNRVRFTSPVPSGAFLRARFTLASVEDLPNGIQANWTVLLEMKDAAKPCLVAEWLTRRHQ